MGGTLNGITKPDKSSETTPEEQHAAASLTNKFNQESGSGIKPVEYSNEAYKQRHSRTWEQMEKAAEDGNDLKAARKYDKILRKEAREYIKSDEAKARPDYEEIKDGFGNLKDDPSRQVQPHNVNRMILGSYRDDEYDGKNINQRQRMVERRIEKGLGASYEQDSEYDAKVARDVEMLDKLKVSDNAQGRDVLATVQSLKNFRPVQTEEQMQGDGEYVRDIVEENYNGKQHALVIPGNEDGSGELYVDLDGVADDSLYIENQIEVNPEVSDSPNVFVKSSGFGFEQKEFLDVNKETGEISYKNAEQPYHVQNENGRGVSSGYEATEEFKQKLEGKTMSRSTVEPVATVPAAGVSMSEAELPKADLPTSLPAPGGP